MRILVLLLLISFALPSAGAGTMTASTEKFLGTWEGESTCTVSNSPCHDEHVVYEIKAKGEGFSIDMFKIVNGEKQFMGSLECKRPEGRSISCTIPEPKRKNEWVFTLSDEKALAGTLYLDEVRMVYRKIHVLKK